MCNVPGSSTMISVLQEKITELPDLNFKRFSDLEWSMDTLGDAIELRLPVSNMTTSESAGIIVSQVGSIFNSLLNKREARDFFSALNRLGDSIGENICDVFNILKTSISPEVQNLKEQILSLAETGTPDAVPLSRIAKYEHDYAIDFEYVDWDDCLHKLGSRDDLIASITENTGVSISSSPTISELKSVCRNADFLGTDYGFSIDSDTHTEIVQRLENRFVQPEVANELIEILTTRYGANTLINNTVYRLISKTEHSDALRSCIDAIDKFYIPILEVMNNPFNVSDEVAHSLKDNAAKMQFLFYVIGLAVMSLREHYKDSIIISKSMLNKDLANGTREETQKLSAYLIVRHIEPGYEIPMSGISLDTIEKDHQVDSDFDRLIRDTKKQIDGIFAASLVHAVKQVLNEYIENDSECTEQCKYLIRNAVNQLTIGDGGDNGLENSLYTFLIDLKYRDTIVGSAHRLFSIHTLRTFDTNSEITDGDAKLINVSVAARLATEFVLNNLCERKK